MIMKKRILSLTLARVLILSFIPVLAFAATGDVVYTDTRNNKITIPGGAKSCATKVVSFTPGNPWTNDERAMDPQKILGLPDYDSAKDINYVTLGDGGSIVLEFDIYIYDGPGMDIYVFEIGPNVEATKVEVSSDLKNWIFVGNADGSLSGVDMAGKVPADGRYKYVRITDLLSSPGGSWPGADIDAVAGMCVKVQENSGWADSEMKKADEYGLIPDCLKGEDLRQPITRREFAGICVRLYENLSGKTALAASQNPFTDTSDTDVLKSYNTHLMVGTAPDKFSPSVILNRETAATALTRVLKKCYIDGWTYAGDANFTLNFTMPAKFADDAKISAWAYPSVYFMAANEIIKGTGNNMFSPRATTAAETAVNYASATREQALAIAVRIVENLKGKPLDYKKN
jgi:hypothetical protein